MARATKVIIGLAWLGVAAYVVVPLVGSGAFAPPATAATLIGVAALVLTLLLCAALPESRVLLQQPCLLVPPSCALGLQTLVGVAYRTADASMDASSWLLVAMGGPGGPGGPVAIGEWLQAAGMLLIWVLHAAWVTPMIVRVVRGERAADVLLPELRKAPALLGRSFCALVFGHAPLLFALLLPLAVTTLLPPSAMFALIIAMFAVMLIVTPLWNLLTATLLLRALDPQRKDWLGIGPAMVGSWQQRHGWMGVLFAQLALLGFVAIVPAQVKVHGLWVGGYVASNHWYADAVGGGWSWHVIDALLRLAGIVLAIAIKVRIARCIEADAVAALRYRAEAAAHR